MVGDSATDVEAAHNAGIPVVVVSFGYTLQSPKSLGGDRLIDHFDELESALMELL
jgi:phosphoglycolate phosphatase